MATIRTVRLKRAVKETDKVSPQGQVVLAAIEKAGGALERSKLVSAVEKKMEGKTVQSASTIVAFQLSELKKQSLIVVDVEKTEEPKKAKNAKKTAA